MKNVLVLMIVSLFIGCTKKGEEAKKDSEVQKSYVISQEDKKNSERDKKNNVPPPFIPVGISMGSNLIIDEYSNIYYYQTNKIGGGCSTGMENDTIPRFIDINPKDLIKIPKDCMERFIDENVMTKEKRKQILIIASQKDTIKDQPFLNFFKNINVSMYVVRRTTQEEDTVLYYKKKDIFYDSKYIKWDKSRIKFPEHIKFAKRPTETAN